MTFWNYVRKILNTSIITGSEVTVVTDIIKVFSITILYYIK